MNLWFGWTEIYVDDDGEPSQVETKWKASAFVFFTHVIWIGNTWRADD